jgi:hypothetical protein
MARKAQLVTEEQFKSLVIEYVSNLSDDDLEEFDSDLLTSLMNGDIYSTMTTLVMMSTLKKVESDWSKIAFDLENCYIDPADKNDHWELGFQTLNNGFTYLGVIAGGDWEHPVYAIIYHDGNTFRGYVPTKGNCFNPVTKTAFGSEYAEIEDEVDEIELGYKGLIALGITVDSMSETDIFKAYDLLDFDFVSIRKDIESRIALSGVYSSQIDTLKIESVIEKVKKMEYTFDIESYGGNGQTVVVYGKSHIPYDDPFAQQPTKSEYHEVISVYEYKHMVNIAKEMLKEKMSLEDFITIAEQSDNVENLVSAAKRSIMTKRVAEASRKLFGDD